jgi:hypothetical protein
MSEKSLALRLALFAAIVAISAPLFGQTLYGSDLTPTNQSSASVNDATVTLTTIGIGDRQHKTLAAGNYPIRGGKAKQRATYYSGVPANSVLAGLVNIAANSDSTFEFRVQARLGISTDQPARVDVNAKGGTLGATVEVAAHAAQIPAGSGPVTNGTETQLTNDIPKYDAESHVLRHAAERRPAAQQAKHQHFRRSINDRQSASHS